MQLTLRNVNQFIILYSCYMDVCYTGYGALPSGNHTQKQYMQVMQKHFHAECPAYIKSLRCDPCIQLSEIDKKLIKKLKRNKSYKLTNRERKKY